MHICGLKLEHMKSFCQSLILGEEENNLTFTTPYQSCISSNHTIFVMSLFRNPGHLQKNHPLYPVGIEKVNSNRLDRLIAERDRKKVDDTQNSLAVNNEVSLATNLTKEVRVLCWIMTGPANHYTKV